MLTSKEIKRQIDLGNITIENLAPNALDKPNSCDLRIGNTMYAFDYDIIDSIKSHDYLNEVLFDKPKNLRRIYIPETGVLLQPHKVYLAKTIERVKTHGFTPVMNGKNSLSLLGVSVELTSGYKNDAFDDYLFLSIVATKPTIIYPDERIANLTFFPSLKESSSVTTISNGMTRGIYKSGMLSGSEIIKRMNQENPDIVITPQDKILVNPNSVNLTLNKTIGAYSEPVLDMKGENPIEYIDIPDDGLLLYPDEIYLGLTNEWTETNNLVPMISGRSSLGRNGLHVNCSAGMGSIGYKGNWHMAIRTVKPTSVVKDMKCCQIYYLTTEEHQETYTSKEETESPKVYIKK